MTTPPFDLAQIKDDLGIPEADTSNDAWLGRRIDGLWQRMESHCMRRLVSPPRQFVDDWGEVVALSRRHNEPPVIAFPARASVFLRVIPVRSIVSIVTNGSPIAAGGVRFDNDTGKLFTVDGAQQAHDLGQELLNGRARITYAAGWDDVPGDLYECLIGALSTLWSSRQSQSAGVGGGTISGINVMDVGSIEVDAGNAFVSAANRGAGAVDPMLGPYTALLETYVDWRAAIGSPLFPTTIDLSVPAPPSPSDRSFIGPSPPIDPEPGDKWFNDTDGREYIFYNDGSGTQWVQADVGT